MATLIQFHTPSDQSCSTSDCTTTTGSSSSSFSDEEIKLASRNPKKRAGRKIFKETRHPIYRGVRRRDSGKWVCEIRQPNNKRRLWLGTYPTPEMAARAHDVGVLATKGRSACLNFADSLWRLPVPESGNVKDIQKAAVEAAEGFRPVVEEREEVVVVGDGVFREEVAVFGMPEFYGYMAEGLMVAPPPPAAGMTVGYDNGGDDVEFWFDGSLWTF